MTPLTRFHKPLAALVVLLLVLLACGTSPAAAPTLDTNVIGTVVMNTVEAAFHQTSAAALPTGTSLTPDTAEPTLTITALLSSTPAMNVRAASGASCIPDNPPQTGKVVQIVDGDTIKVLLDEDGKVYTVRYIGMDTPETTNQVEYFGAEASAKNAQLVYGKNAALVRDVSETDMYGRLLRYVIVDNLFINYELVAQGFANTASYPPDIACIPAFQEAEQKARVSGLGLWNAPPTVVALPTQPPTGGGSANAPCNCTGPDLDCKDFQTHASAQACYDYCVAQGFGNIFRLDGNDNDGLACESLP